MRNIHHIDIPADELDKLGLKRDPFAWLPEQASDYFYGTDMGLVELALHQTIHRPGIAAVTGEVGSGKSSTVRRFVEVNLLPNKEYVVSWVDAPQMRRVDMRHVCQKLLHDFQGDLNTGRAIMKVAENVRDTVEGLADEGIRPVLIIEDAQLLGLQPLRELKLLYELRRRIKHILAIILIGQPELFATLQRQDMRQLAQRCRMHRVHGLKRDLPQYVKHRFKKAHASAEDYFHPEALKELIAHPAISTPMEVNVLCAKALRFAFKQGEQRVSREMMVTVLSAHGGDEGGTPIEVEIPASPTKARRVA